MAKLKPIMTTPQTAIGKGTVGDPPDPEEGKEAVLFKVAVFFDGTMNNRTNSKLRLDMNEAIKDGSKKDLILDEDKKDMLSSYANYYSNVAILELLNLQRNRNIQEVSVYMEGIGTVDFKRVEGAIALDDKGQERKDAQGNKILATDADFSNDEMGGFAFGTGETGIVDRVTQGIRKAKVGIKAAYKKDKQYIQKITIDVIGFSRGAAAARHFVSRYEGFRGVWPQKSIPELVINFVGLFETVSSYHESGELGASIRADLTGKLFSKNVGELQLAMGGVPKRVIHLTAQDEIRRNFSLTTIDSSLRVGGGKAFQISLPGVHSDIGGGYVERDPDNPEMDPTKTYPNDPGRPAIRLLNRENRRILNREEKRQLVEEGWYTDGTNGTPNQFKPVDKYEHAAYLNFEHYRQGEAKRKGRPYQPSPYTREEYGSRHLTNEYQYVSLYLMMGMAKNDFKPGTHDVMKFANLAGAKFATYRVPPDLVAVRNHFAKYIADDAPDGKEHNRLDFESTAQEHLTRNKYLHRSSVLLKDPKVSIKDLKGSVKDLKTYAAYRRAPHDMRVIYSDTGESADGTLVKVPDLGMEEPTVDDTATGAPAAEQVPTGGGLGEAGGTSELNEGP